VQIFKDHEHGLHLTLAQEHTFERSEGVLATLRRVHGQEGAVIRERVEQR
jgi:hypothetical protein